MGVKLFNADCLDILPTLEDGSVDMVLCDLPYGTTANDWDKVIPLDKLWPEYKRLVKKGGAIVLFAAQPFTSHLILSNPKMFKYSLVWEKEQGSMPMQAPFQPIKVHEDIAVFSDAACSYSKNGSMNYYPQMTEGEPYKGTIRKGGNIKFHSDPSLHERRPNSGTRYPKSVLKFNTERGLHPTQKPVSLCEWLVKTYTQEGATVLDNTMGSGSVGVACLNTNRSFIGIEMDKVYFNVAATRLGVPC